VSLAAWPGNLIASDQGQSRLLGTLWDSSIQGLMSCLVACRILNRTMEQHALSNEVNCPTEDPGLKVSQQKTETVKKDLLKRI